MGSMSIKIAAFMAGMLLASATAFGAAGVSDSVTTVTVTTTSGNCIADKPYRSALTLDATGASANIGYCEGENCTAAIGTAGTTTISSGTLFYWPSGSAPQNAMCFIAASGSQPLTIREGRQ
jgi:hypothetical protein